MRKQAQHGMFMYDLRTGGYQKATEKLTSAGMLSLPVCTQQSKAAATAAAAAAWHEC
jgi:hypothetical protein